MKSLKETVKADYVNKSPRGIAFSQQNTELVETAHSWNNVEARARDEFSSTTRPQQVFGLQVWAVRGPVKSLCPTGV